jgi:hypothetical protein
MSRILITIHSEIAEFLGDSPEQIEPNVLEILVLDLYRRHRISGVRAAEFLAVDKLTFVHWAGENGSPYYRTTPEDWQHELESIGTP